MNSTGPPSASATWRYAVGVDVGALLGARVGLRPLALLVHQLAEADLVDQQSLLLRHLQGQVDREAVGVVEREGALPAEHGVARTPYLGGGLVEDRGAGPERLPEGVLLGVGDLRDPLPVAVQLVVGLAHLVAADRQQLGQHAVLGAEQAHRPHRAAQQPAQHVAATLVARGHAVADQHHRAADVVGDHPEAHVVLVVRRRTVRPVSSSARSITGYITSISYMLSTPWSRQATRSRPMPVSMFLLRQRPDDVEVLLGPHGAQLVLHEDEVPDLQVAVLELGRHLDPVGGLELAVGAVLGAAVVEDLRARAARPGHAHRPVVLLRPELDDPLVRQPGHLHPQMERLVVAVQDRGPEPALLQAVAAVGLRLGDEVPGELDRPLLEVVAEGEVAAHLEERAVPGGLADVLDVGGAHALLDAHRAVVRRRLLAEEVGLERHHAGVDEQQVRVVEDEGRRGHGGVGGVLEVSHEPSPDLRGVHQFSPSCVVLVGRAAVVGARRSSARRRATARTCEVPSSGGP